MRCTRCLCMNRILFGRHHQHIWTVSLDALAVAIKRRRRRRRTIHGNAHLGSKTHSQSPERTRVQTVPRFACARMHRYINYYCGSGTTERSATCINKHLWALDIYICLFVLGQVQMGERIYEWVVRRERASHVHGCTSSHRMRIGIYTIEYIIRSSARRANTVAWNYVCLLNTLWARVCWNAGQPTYAAKAIVAKWSVSTGLVNSFETN